MSPHEAGYHLSSSSDHTVFRHEVVDLDETVS